MIVSWILRLIQTQEPRIQSTSVSDALGYIDRSLDTIDKKLESMSDAAKIMDKLTRSGAVSLVIVSMRDDGSMIVTHGYGKSHGLVVGEDVPKGVEFYDQLKFKSSSETQSGISIFGSTIHAGPRKESRYFAFLTIDRDIAVGAVERFCVVLVVREGQNQ